MAIHVIDEAKRCLNCKKPQCQQGCPIHTSIPEVIKALRENRLNEAGQILFDNNPLSLVCSLVCDHDHQCEGHCILGRKGSPVHISSIEHYISDTYYDKMKLECEPKKGKNVAVIGAGPAGITIAFVLTKMGYDITIFVQQVTHYERADKPAANEHEVSYAKLYGAEFEFDMEVQEILPEGLVFKRPPNPVCLSPMIKDIPPARGFLPLVTWFMSLRQS